MKKYSIKTRLMLCIPLIGMWLFSSCDLLDTEPANSLDPETALSSLEAMEALSISMHSRMRAESRYGRDLALMGDALADNVTLHPITSGRYQRQSRNQHGGHYGLWGTAWSAINEANFIIADIDLLQNVTDAVRSRLLGEAHFHRAFAYHDLVRIYGYEPGREVNGWDLGVMIRTEPTRDVTQADDRARATNREVYDLIEEDLLKAIDFLAGGDRGVFYANHAGALTLMARVQLYLENWEAAIDYATQAMDAASVNLVSASTYTGTNMYEAAPNPESIFELRILLEESLGSSDALDQYTQPNGWFDVLPSQELIDMYEPGDVRLSLIAYSGIYPYFLKYTGSVAAFTDNVPIFRYPELLLTRAEAHAELALRGGGGSHTADAQTDLATLRTARGLGPVSVTGAALVEAILNERQKEFAFEGQRWFDLKRKGMDIPKPEGNPPLRYDDYRILSPIPNSEINDANFVNVRQNPGY